MRDYVIALAPQVAATIAQDWYKVHKLLSDQMGERVSDAGGAQETLWQFCADPRPLIGDPHAPSRFIVVRASEASAPSIERLAIASEDVYVPAQGERVRFWLGASAKFSASIDIPAARFAASASGTSFEEGCARTLLAKSGLSDPSFDGPVASRRYDVWKDRRASRPIVKHGVFASGEADVSGLSALRLALASGVGRDRGFGFGVLILEPVGE